MSDLCQRRSRDGSRSQGLARTDPVRGQPIRLHGFLIIETRGPWRQKGSREGDSNVRCQSEFDFGG